MNAQDTQIRNLERQGWTFSNWIASQPDANGDSVDGQQTAVMVKRSKHSTVYSEIEPDGTVTF